MKTLRVRPVLVESKKRTELLIEDNKLIIVEPTYRIKYKASFKQLILISLEDEKIEVGDKCYLPISKKLKIADTPYHNEFGWKKVIATQSQISPEYISKFMEQYNNGCVDDLEITMEEPIVCYLTINPNCWDEHKVAKTSKAVPKLTNGFVTIIEKELIYLPIEVKKDSIVLYGAGKFHEERLIINRGQAALLFVELYKFLEFDKSSSKESTIYTE